MSFQVVFETGSGRRTKILQPALEVRERGDVLEAAVGEGRPVIALGRSQPADLAVQAVIVEVLDVAAERGLGVGEGTEDLAVEHLLLQEAPEALDLAVRPGRIDLGLDVADAQLLKRPAKAGEHARHPVHEQRAVVAHHVERLAAQLDAVAQPGEDRLTAGAGLDLETEHEAGVVVDEPDEPGLEVALRSELDEEGTLDVDVPQRVGARALVAGSGLARQRGPRRPEVVEEPLDPPVAHARDLAPRELGGDALGAPVRLQAHRDHDLLDPAGVRTVWLAWSAALGQERGEPAPLVCRLPAEEARPARVAKIEHRSDALLAHDPKEPGARADRGEPAARLCHPGRTAAACRQEAEPRPLLVGMPKPAAVGVADLVRAPSEDRGGHRIASSLPPPEGRKVFSPSSKNTLDDTQGRFQFRLKPR